MPRSPRIVPGAASRGLVAPIIVRTTFQVSSGPSTTSDHGRAAGDERRRGRRRRACRRARRSAGRRCRRRSCAARRRRCCSPCALEAGDDLADEATFDGVGLADDEGAIHRAGTLAEALSRRNDRARAAADQRPAASGEDCAGGAGDDATCRRPSRASLGRRQSAPSTRRRRAAPPSTASRPRADGVVGRPADRSTRPGSATASASSHQPGQRPAAASGAVRRR